MLNCNEQAEEYEDDVATIRTTNDDNGDPADEVLSRHRLKEHRFVVSFCFR